MPYRRFDELKARIGFGQVEADAMAQLRLDGADRLGDAVKALAAHAVLPASLAPSRTEPAQVWRQWLDDAMAGPHNTLYARRRQEVGRRHADLGLPQYMVDMVIEAVEDQLTQVAEAVYHDDSIRRRAARRAVRKICHLDMAAVLSGYQRRRAELTGQRHHRERRRLQVELTAHQSFANTMLDAAPVGVMAVNERGEVTAINPKMRELLGHSMEELSDRETWLARAFPDAEGRQEAEMYFAAAASHDPPEEKILLSVRRGDGSRRFMEFWTTPVVVADEHLGAVTIAFDVTERQRLEQQLIRAERLAAIGELAASLAHEVKNPLAGIRGAIQVMRSQMANDDVHRDILEEVLHQLGRLDSTMRDLLIYSRPNPLEMRRGRLDTVIDRVLTVVSAEPAFHRMQFVKSFSPDLPEIDLDADQVEQVCMNIVLNAAQAMDDGGRVTIDAYRDDDQVVLAFTDDGPGIANHQVSRVFEAFYTTKSRGTGLGLPICKRIVEAHGGAIALTGDRGQGTRVTITLPIRHVGPSGPKRRLEPG